MPALSSDEFMASARFRLEQEGYGWRDPDLQVAGAEVLGSATRSRFEAAKFGNSEEFFTFARVGRLDAEGIDLFSTAAFNDARNNVASFLPVGLLNSVWVFPVMVAFRVVPAAADVIRRGARPKHWSGAEIPVAIDLTKKDLIYFEGTPAWGAAYYKRFREDFERLLAPA